MFIQKLFKCYFKRQRCDCMQLVTYRLRTSKTSNILSITIHIYQQPNIYTVTHLRFQINFKEQEIESNARFFQADNYQFKMFTINNVMGSLDFLHSKIMSSNSILNLRFAISLLTVKQIMLKTSNFTVKVKPGLFQSSLCVLLEARQLQEPVNKIAQQNIRESNPGRLSGKPTPLLLSCGRYYYPFHIKLAGRDTNKSA